jgi:chromosome segregation protein
MFKSVGLNIDHPETFFVRQGRITKIVNFKPGDLREMLEEAAGIAYYKEISGKCIKIIKNKAERHKLEEERMQKNLGPKLQQLDREKKIEQEYDGLAQELKQKEQSLDSIDFIHYTKIVEESEQVLTTFDDRLQELETEKHFLEEDKKQLLEELKGETTNEEEEESSEIKQFRVDIKVLEKEYKDLILQEENCKENIKSKKADLEKDVKRYDEAREKFDKQGIEIEMDVRKLETLKEREEELEMKIKEKHSDSLKLKMGDKLQKHEQLKKTIAEYKKKLQGLEVSSNLNEDKKQEMKKKFEELKQQIKHLEDIVRKIPLKFNRIQFTNKEEKKSEEQKKANLTKSKLSRTTSATNKENSKSTEADSKSSST